jgi:hypothetical protein
MSHPKDELPAPGAAVEDARSFELLRVWYAHDAPRTAARAGLWPDPAAWGFVLAEAARQLAREYADETDADAAVALARLRAGFDAELGGGASPLDAMHDG